jgi:hypothetical protein
LTRGSSELVLVFSGRNGSRIKAAEKEFVMEIWEDCYGNEITITNDKVILTDGSFCERLRVIAGKEYLCEKTEDAYIRVVKPNSEKLEFSILVPGTTLKVNGGLYSSFHRIQ